MSLLEKQTLILGELCQILHEEADEGYDFAECEYIAEYETISSQFNFMKNGEIIRRHMSLGIPGKNRDLCEELRSLMKEHTGGEWTSFTLTLDADGNATTKFVYPED